MIENVYQYKVEIESIKSQRLREIIFKKFVSNNFPNVSVVFDSVQHAYAPQRLETGQMQCNTQIVHPETKKECEYMVTIQEENDCEISIKKDLRE